MTPHLQPGVVGSFPCMGCMAPQSFVAGWNQSYLVFWAVTGGLRYKRYITPIVAPKPFVERVAGAGHSTVGGTGTHGIAGTSTGFGGEIAELKPLRSQLGVLRWCPPCTPDAASEVEAQAEVKFHMY
jgi:hypothetical protein